MPFLLLVFAAVSAVGAPVCMPELTLADASRFVASSILKVAQIDGADRESADDFGHGHEMTAEAVKDRYAASGDLDCPEGEGQAQVTLTRDTIVTSAHNFDDELNCKHELSFAQCRFITRVDGVEKIYKIKRVAATGHHCPLPRHRRETAPENDWIVLKLEVSVDSQIEPYRLAPRGRQFRRGEAVVAVAKSFDWPSPGPALRDQPRHYGDCRVRDVERNHGGALAFTTCDMSSGSSGGAMLTPGAYPSLLGVVRGEIDALRTKSCGAAKSRAGRGAYDSACWAGGFTTITGAFRKAITAAAKSRD